MSRLQTLLNHRISSSDFWWDDRYGAALVQSQHTDSIYVTSTSKIGLRVPLMKQIQWIHQNV